MNLKQDILDVLAKYGVEQNQIDALVEHFTAQSVAADASVATLTENIASLQKQLEEETGRAVRLKEGIAKFVVFDEPVEAAR
jgi:hypothetical protein